MAFLSKGITFEGSLGDFSAYRMKGSDRIIIRHKGGPSKKKIKTDPGMVNTRRTMSEFGVATRAASHIIRMLVHRQGWSMYGVQGALTGVLMHLRRTDTTSTWGERGIRFSQNPRVLDGFSLSPTTPFDNSIVCPIRTVLSREQLSAQIDLPALIPGVNLTLPVDRPQFRLVAELIIVPDFTYIPKNNRFEPMPGYSHFDSTLAMTDWYASRNGSAATTLHLNLEVVPPDQHFALMLTLGLELGIKHDNEVEPVQKAGAAKILAMT